MRRALREVGARAEDILTFEFVGNARRVADFEIRDAEGIAIGSVEEFDRPRWNPASSMPS